jgi:streptogramin lyase
MDGGKYRVWTNAVSFETGRGEVDLTATKHQDFTLKPMADFVRQMSGDELLASLPEDSADDRHMKRVFRNACTTCHQPNYILQNRFDSQGWTAILNLMRVINITGGYNGEDAAASPAIEYHKKELADYLARMRGPGPTAMKIKLRPRPTGEAARVVYTEYDVPLDPANGYETKYMTNDGSDWSLGTPSDVHGGHGVHDAQTDFNGNIWFTYNVASADITVGRADAKTGEVKFFAVPGSRGNASSSHGITRDQKGFLWFNVNKGTGGNTGSLGRIDPDAQKIDVFTPPKGMTGTASAATTIDVDGKGKVWVTAGIGALRFDPDTERFTEFKSLTQSSTMGTPGTYGLAGDSEGNGWWEQINIDTIGKSDIETGKSLEVKLPPAEVPGGLFTAEEQKMYEMSGDSSPWAEAPRRMGADHNGKYVYACDWLGGNLAQIDIDTLKVKMIPMPDPLAEQPYHAVVDSNHNVWVNLMGADKVMRYEPSSGKWTEFPGPTLGGETRYFSILERNGSMQLTFPYARARKVAHMTFRTSQEIQALKNQVQQQERAQARM